MLLIANEGDNATIHFYNLDPADRHTFTIDAPYNVNVDLLPLHQGTVMFKVNQEGIFRFYCNYHQPTMVGQTCSATSTYCRKNWFYYHQVKHDSLIL